MIRIDPEVVKHILIYEHYLDYRLLSTRYVVEHLHDAGIPVVRPAGGHAVYLDARRFLPHIDALQYPGQAPVVEFYIEGIEALLQRREGISGMRILEAPQFLHHFTAIFDWA